MIKERACSRSFAFESGDGNHDGEFETFGGVDGHDLHGVVIAAFLDKVAVFVIGVIVVVRERF